MGIHEQFCQTKEGKTFLYLAEKFLDEVKESILKGETRTYHKEFCTKVGELNFALELREFLTILFHADLGDDRISTIVFDRDTKNFLEENRHLKINGAGIDGRNFSYMKGIFDKINDIDKAVHKANRETIALELDEQELKLLHFKGKEELKETVKTSVQLERKIKKSNIDDELKELLLEKVEPVFTYINEESKLNAEQKHTVHRFIEEDVPNLLDLYLSLGKEEQTEQKETFKEALLNMGAVIHDEVKKQKLVNFKKHLTLFTKRYQA